MRNLIILIGLALMVTIGGCGRPSHPVNTLVVGIAQPLSTLDPAMHRERIVEAVIRNVFDGLVTRDASMRLIPELAESWTMVDPLTWRFNLRHGVRFHNGEPFTADDVVFTFERILTPGAVDGISSPRKGLLGPMIGVEKVDDATVQFRTSVPWPVLPVMLCFQEIVPKDYVTAVGARHFAQHPIGTGPFRFVEWVKGERLVMERFEGYYNQTRRAHTQRLIVRPIPESSSRVAALKAGECDLIQNLPPHLVQPVTRDPRTRVSACEGTRTFYLGLNCTRPPFDDVRVRQAMNYAVNMPHIIQTILEDKATRLAGPLVHAAFGHHPDLRPYPYDPSLARRLLAEAAHTNGFACELDVEHDNREIAEAISAQLAQVGITARVRVWEWGGLRPRLERLERTLFITSWGNASLDPIDILNPTLRTMGRGNYTGYSNPVVDSLLDKAARTLDGNARRVAYRQIQEVVHTDAPWIFGYSMQEIYGIRRRLHGWRPRPDGWLLMRDVSGL